MSKGLAGAGRHHSRRPRLLRRTAATASTSTASASTSTAAGPRSSRTRHRGILRAGVLVVFAMALIVVAVGVGTGRWQIRPVLSGSMRPGLPVGGVVVTERVPLGSLRVGDVAVFHPPGARATTYVHRIISLQDGPDGVVVRTKGDANLEPDPWALRLHGRWAYQARFSLPLLGYPAVWIHSPGGRRVLLVAAGVLFALLAASLVADLRKRRGTRPSTALTTVVGEGGDQET